MRERGRKVVVVMTSKLMEKIFILAGSKQEYDYYTKDHSYHLHDLEPHYVTREQDFMGNRGAQFITVGTFWEREDARKLYDAADTYLSDKD